MTKTNWDTKFMADEPNNQIEERIEKYRELLNALDCSKEAIDDNNSMLYELLEESFKFLDGLQQLLTQQRQEILEGVKEAVGEMKVHRNDWKTQHETLNRVIDMVESLKQPKEDI